MEKEKGKKVDLTPYINKDCKECFGRGFIGTNAETKESVVCPKCVRKNYMKYLNEQRRERLGLK